MFLQTLKNNNEIMKNKNFYLKKNPDLPIFKKRSC